MGKTEIKGKQIKNSSIGGEDLNTTGTFQVGKLGVGQAASAATAHLTGTFILPAQASGSHPNWESMNNHEFTFFTQSDTLKVAMRIGGTQWTGSVASLTEIGASDTGAFTLGLFSGGTSYRTGYHASSITSINDDDGDDIKFKIVYGSTTVDKTSESQSATQTVGTANSKKYSAVKFMAEGASATVTLVQLVVTAVATATTAKVKIYSSTGFGGSSAPDSISGGASDAATIDGAGTISFTWSSNAPTVTQGSSWWIVYEDQSS